MTTDEHEIEEKEYRAEKYRIQKKLGIASGYWNDETCSTIVSHMSNRSLEWVVYTVEFKCGPAWVRQWKRAVEEEVLSRILFGEMS